MKQRMMRLSTMIYVLSSLTALLCMAERAEAYNPFGRGMIDSYAIINKIPAGHGSLTTAEMYFLVLVDPPLSSVSGLSNSISYDPAKYIFRSDFSTLLGEFAQGGTYIPDSAAYGTFLMSDLPAMQVDIGLPLPGSTLTVTNDAIAGVASMDYVLSTPLQLGGEDKNFFAFAFQAKTPYNPYATTITFHDQPGSYDFNQVSSGCTSTDRCGSNTPVYGMSIKAVPEPGTYALFLSGIAAVAGGIWRRMKRGGTSKSR